MNCPVCGQELPVEFFDKAYHILGICGVELREEERRNAE